MFIWYIKKSPTGTAHRVRFHHTAIDNPMIAGQTMKASWNLIFSEFHPLTWVNPSNPISVIIICITPAPCIPPLTLNPLPTAHDFSLAAVLSVGTGANLDTGEGLCVGWADELADNDGGVKWEFRVEVDVWKDWTGSGFGVILKSAV